MQTAFYYIHGFNSGFNPDAPKVKYFETLGKVYGRTTDYLDPHDVDALVADIEAVQDSLDGGLDYAPTELVLVGTSLGGYIARYIAANLNMRLIIVNPSMTPYITLKRAVGWPMTNYVTGKATIVTDELVEAMERYAVGGTPDCLCILAKQDEVVDYREAQGLLAAKAKIVLTDGDHRLEDVNKLHDEIVRFINATPAHGS